MSARRQAPTPQGFQRPVTAAAMSGVVIVETAPGVYDFAVGAAGDAVIEETEDAGVFDFTAEPGGRAQARLLMVGLRGAIL